VALTEEQRDRLAAALSAQLGFDVQINVVIDPEVVGGLRISLGGELIDGTLSSRIGDAQRRIAS
jgi:F-type H+-transporting ATPase subunit delta